MRESRHRLYKRLLDDVSDYTIFYVGFRRHDTDFTRVLLDVEQAVGPLSGLRRSFALQPGFDEVVARRWEQKRVSLIDAPAADFFRQLLETIPEDRRYVSEKTGSRETESPLLTRKPNVSTEVLQDVERNFELVDERIRDLEPNLEDFFTGAAPT